MKDRVRIVLLAGPCFVDAAVGARTNEANDFVLVENAWPACISFGFILVH